MSKPPVEMGQGALLSRPEHTRAWVDAEEMEIPAFLRRQMDVVLAPPPRQGLVDMLRARVSALMGPKEQPRVSPERIAFALGQTDNPPTMRLADLSPEEREQLDRELEIPTFLARAARLAPPARDDEFDIPDKLGKRRVDPA